MNAKKFIFKILVAIISFIPTSPAISATKADSAAMDSMQMARLIKYEKRMMRMQERWHHLIPSYYKIQYAGNMGLLSFGTGWAYGKNRQWETDLFIGFIPKYESDKVKVTLTVKQNFIPWKLDVGKYFSFEPLACGIYLNTILSNQFWVRQPERYPKGYYWFATKLRPNIYIGQRFTFNISPDKRFIAKAITVFYEISTCDYYILSHIGNSGYPLHDLISLSFGVKFQIL